MKEKKYRGFHFNDDQILTKEDGRKYIEIIEYEEIDIFGDCLEEIKNTEYYLDELEKENKNCKRKILNFDHNEEED